MEQTNNIILPDEIVGRLDNLPGLIKDKQLEILEKQDYTDSLEVTINFQKNSILAKVSEEADGEGKKLFKNAEQREHTTEVRIKDDKELSEFIRQKIKALKELKELKIGLEFLDNKFKAARSMTEILKEVK